ncbi:MAG: restriction endonuclease subunit S [Tannerella sp.]|jgi:type I restriction enzyme S subunit|nr:restriction endonuclease subunit S [Tannerella sp.]
MQNNYKPIGKYIRLVDRRNADLTTKTLLGLTVSKQFIPSVANIIGTDMANYKVISRNQFACSTMQVRRDKKMPVALLKDWDAAIISPAYPVFEVVDEQVLLPDYLMMWFSRTEFDREACFHAIGGVRGSLEWEDFCNMRLPVPSIEKQRAIIAEYNVIKDRITLNNRLIQKLEETAKAIYNHWFVDFEFPDKQGKPYKSNGGEMINSELGPIPKGWKVGTVKDYCVEIKSGGTPSREIANYWNRQDIPWLKTGEIHNNILIQSEEFISQSGYDSSSAKILPKDTILMAMYGATAGQLGILKFEASTNQACCGMICKNQLYASFLYYYLLKNQQYIKSQAIGGAQDNLSKNFIESFPILIPTNYLIENYVLKKLIDYTEVLTIEIKFLENLETLILTKMSNQ